jgi:YVTN family beta-propeller protein
MTFRHRVAIVSALLAAVALAFSSGRIWKIGRQSDGSYLIPTGQFLTPAGTHIEVNDRPLGMVLSPDEKSLAVVTGSNFAPRALHIIDIASASVRQTLPLGDSFAGVAFSPSGDLLYVGGGQDHDIKVFHKSGERFQLQTAWKIANSAPSGLALSADGSTLYAALNLKHAVAIIDTRSGAIDEVPVGSYPYTVAVTPEQAFVTNWAGRRPRPSDRTDGVYPVVLDPRGIPASGTVSVIDTRTKTVTAEIEVGLHPSGMAIHSGTHRLYVANANSDSISVADTRRLRLISSINVRPFQKAPLGSSPNAVAISSNGRTLYVANAANNAIAVVDVSKKEPVVQGFIPTGWYPTAVAVSPDSRRLYVASGYGFGSIAPTRQGAKGRSYRDRVGIVSLMDAPAGKQLAGFTKQVMQNNHAAQPVPASGRQPSSIKHVFYVIKENRTYDQVFGDLPQANGDPSLVQFGREVTPNHHALVEQYTILDNFYAPGDQSALGHRWCTQGYAGDWLHKYGNGRNDQNPMLFAPTGFLWDNAKEHGLPVRSYGERGLVTITPAKSTWTDIYRDWKSGAGRISITARTPILGLQDIYSTRYPGFSMLVTDQYRVDRFLEDFRGYEKNGDLPPLVLLLLPNDHTSGTAPGFPTPRAMVADNDLALGRLVEAISHSRYWKESAIFVVEDDAQNGLDHVDGHRTVAMVISPWVRRKSVDSNFYTTIHMYRTIEQILGLPPTSQFDLAAEPMFSVFTSEPDDSPFTALPNRIPLDEMNPPLKAVRGLQRQLAQASMGMDFDEPDEAPEDLLNRAIWHSVRGYKVLYPKH